MQESFKALAQAARAWCKRAYLMESGEIIRPEQYKKLSFINRLRVVAYADGGKITKI